jgi:hypothetical protein
LLETFLLVLYSKLDNSKDDFNDSFSLAVQILRSIDSELEDKFGHMLSLDNYILYIKQVESATHAALVAAINMRGTLFVIETELASSNTFIHILISSDPAPIRGHYFIDRRSTATKKHYYVFREISIDNHSIARVYSSVHPSCAWSISDNMLCSSTLSAQFSQSTTARRSSRFAVASRNGTVGKEGA